VNYLLYILIFCLLLVYVVLLNFRFPIVYCRDIFVSTYSENNINLSYISNRQ